MDSKKYMTAVGMLLALLIILGIGANIVMSTLTDVFSVILNISIILLVIIIIFSIIITSKVINDKNVNTKLMKINFKIVGIIFPIITIIGNIAGIPKNELRKVFVKLNNTYIYSNQYNFKPEDLLVLIPHCIQKNSCKLKVTTQIENCASCGLCNVADLLKLKEDYDVKVFIATGGTLARKIIMDNRPKAVIAVACERDLTAGIQDIKNIPVLGVFNKRPNGPCVDTSIDICEVEKAVKFFTNNK